MSAFDIVDIDLILMCAVVALIMRLNDMIASLRPFLLLSFSFLIKFGQGNKCLISALSSDLPIHLTLRGFLLSARVAKRGC